MKLLLIFISLNSFMVLAQSVEGSYDQKDCAKFFVSDRVNPAFLVTEIEKSKSFIVTKTDVGFIVDGDTDYWNMAPIVFTKSGRYGVNDVRIKQLIGNDSHFKVFIKSVTGLGVNETKDKFEIMMKKNSDQSLRFTFNHKYKNMLTLGFWRKSADLDCTFR